MDFVITNLSNHSIDTLLLIIYVLLWRRDHGTATVYEALEERLKMDLHERKERFFFFHFPPLLPLIILIATIFIQTGEEGAIN